jgi:SnoaL-like domain
MLAKFWAARPSGSGSCESPIIGWSIELCEGSDMQDTELEVLLAKQAVTEQLYKYCRAMDRCDHKLGYSVWHKAGTAEYGPGPYYQGTGAGFVDFALNLHQHLLTHSHCLSNVLIEVSGTKAVSESYGSITMRLTKDDKIFDHWVSARYLDAWSFVDGAWAIDHRLCGIDFDRIIPVDLDLAGFTAGTGERPKPFTGWGKRDGSDPSYSVFAKLSLGR